METVAFGQIQVANSIDEFPTEADSLIVGQNDKAAHSFYLLAHPVRLMKYSEKADNLARFGIQAETLRGARQIAAQIVILAKLRPFSAPASPDLELPFRSRASAKKELIVSVSNTQSGCR